MRDRGPRTQTMKASEARQRWSELLGKVSRRETRVIVERSGTPVAAIVSAEDLDRLAQFDAEQAERLDGALERMRAAFADVPEEQLERDVAEVVERVRREERKAASPKTA
jgi:prevent-host-death family protein